MDKDERARIIEEEFATVDRRFFMYHVEQEVKAPRSAKIFVIPPPEDVEPYNGGHPKTERQKKEYLYQAFYKNFEDQDKEEDAPRIPQVEGAEPEKDKKKQGKPKGKKAKKKRAKAEEQDERGTLNFLEWYYRMDEARHRALDRILKTPPCED